MKGSKTLHNKRHGLGDLQLPVTCDFTPADDPKKDRPKVATKGMDMVTSTVTFTTWGLDSQVLPFQDIFQVSLQNPCLQVGPAPKNHHPVIKYRNDDRTEETVPVPPRRRQPRLFVHRCRAQVLEAQVQRTGQRTASGMRRSSEEKLTGKSSFGREDG